MFVLVDDSVINSLSNVMDMWTFSVNPFGKKFECLYYFIMPWGQRTLCNSVEPALKMNSVV